MSYNFKMLSPRTHDVVILATFEPIHGTQICVFGKKVVTLQPKSVCY